MAPAIRKGILLAAGRNSRLYPSTLATAKSLLQVYDKPLIYYPLSTLMLTGIRDILVITTPEARASHEALLGDGAAWNIKLSYATQEQPRGISDALVIAEEYLAGAASTLILGDNIFWGGNLDGILQQAMHSEGAVVYCYAVPDPERFGVAEIDDMGKVLSLEEKPADPKSTLAVTGCYFLDATASTRAASLKPSARGELEITDLLDMYRQQGQLTALELDSDIAWLDAGTADSLLDAAVLVQMLHNERQVTVGSPEQVAFANGWIDPPQLLAIAARLGDGQYASFLRHLAEATLN